MSRMKKRVPAPVVSRAQEIVLPAIDQELNLLEQAFAQPFPAPGAKDYWKSVKFRSNAINQQIQTLLNMLRVLGGAVHPAGSNAEEEVAKTEALQAALQERLAARGISVARLTMEPTSE